MPVVCLGGMEGRFRLGKTEDQPSVTGVYGRKPQCVTKEVAVGLCVLTVDDYMRAVDHRILLPFHQSLTDKRGMWPAIGSYRRLVAQRLPIRGGTTLPHHLSARG